MAAVTTACSATAAIEIALRCLLAPGRHFLRHYDETLEHRIKIADCLACLPLVEIRVRGAECTRKEQERARRRLLTKLLPNLHYVDGIHNVIIESRGGSDKLDRKTVDRLRRSRCLTTSFRVDHARKADSALLWIPDFVVGGLLAARFHNEAQPWQILSSAFTVDVELDL